MSDHTPHFWGFGSDGVLHRREKGGWPACGRKATNGHGVTCLVKVYRNPDLSHDGYVLCPDCVDDLTSRSL